MEILSNVLGMLLAMLLFGTTTAHTSKGVPEANYGMPSVEVWCTQPESAGDERCK